MHKSLKKCDGLEVLKLKVSLKLSVFILLSNGVNISFCFVLGEFFLFWFLFLFLDDLICAAMVN